MDSKFVAGFLMEFLALACLIIGLFGLKSVLRRVPMSIFKKKKILLWTSIGVFVWVAVCSFLSLAGFFSNLNVFPPRPIFLLLGGLILSFGITYTQSGKLLLLHCPPHWLVFVQVFRIGVELVLWYMFIHKLLPVQMTLEGLNMDIFSGLLAIPAGWLLQRDPIKWKNVGIGYNIIGIILLVNILVVAVLSMPVFSYFQARPYNTIVAEFPFILLPGVLVVIALMYHVFSLRQLFLIGKTRFSTNDE